MLNLPSIAFSFSLAAMAFAQDPKPPVTPPGGDEKSEQAKTPPEDRAEFAYMNSSGEQPYVEVTGVLARDPRTGDLGVLVMSSAPACGSFAIAGDARIGVTATGGIVDPTWAAHALRLLGEKQTPEAAIAGLLEETTKTAQDRHLLVMLGADGQTGLHRGHAVLGGEDATRARVAPDWVAFGVLAGAANTLDSLSAAAETTAGLPLPERLLAAAQAAVDGAPPHNNGYPRILNSRVVSIALLVVRTGGGRIGQGDRLVDLRVDYDKEPLDRLRGLYHVWTRAHLAPTLRTLQRSAKIGSPAAQADLEWLRRIRAGKKPGEK